MSRERLDLALVSAGWVTSRERARRLVEAGAVRVDGRVVTKPAFAVDAGSRIELDDSSERYVSRGGLKLEAALRHFHVPVEGLHCLDVGASSGGFTDCLLLHGAARVVAIDAGHGQMNPALKADPRVLLMEKVNARHLPPGSLPGLFSGIVIDVSFISLTLILPAVAAWACAGAWLIALIKPQFEVGPEKIGKGGVVRKDEHRREAVDKILTCVSGLNGWTLEGVIDSPIAGGDGNQEYLVCIKKSAA